MMKPIYRWSSGVLFIALIFWTMGCAGTRKLSADQQRRLDDVQGAMTALANALQFYYQDHGFFPEGLATLKDAEYLAISPDIEREWELRFSTGAGKVIEIEAVSRPMMPDGAGHKVIYRVQEGTWTGYGFTEFP